MNRYRVWIGLAVTNQYINNIAIKKNEYHCFHNDREVEEWVKNRIKGIVDYYTWYASGKYAILREDGSYIIGRYVG